MPSSPVTKEVHDYALWLGINLETFPDLAFLALEGLRAPLPSPWRSTTTPDGDVYFYDTESGATAWEHPADATYRARAQAEIAMREAVNLSPRK